MSASWIFKNCMEMNFDLHKKFIPLISSGMTHAVYFFSVFFYSFLKLTMLLS